MSKNDQDPFGSISISPQQEKSEPDQADLDVFIDQPEDLPKAKKKKEAAAPPPSEPDIEPDIEEQLEELAPSLTARRRKLKKPVPKLPIILAAALVIVFLTYTLIGFVGVPYFFRNVIPERAEKNLHRAITFGSVSFNPFSLRLTLQNTIIGPNLANPDDQIDPLFSAGSITADISWSTLFRRQLNCANLTVDNLFLHLVRDEQQQYNLADILPIRQNQAIPMVNLPFAYFLQNITVTNSRVLFDDLPTKKSHKLEDINLALPLLFHTPEGGAASQSFSVSDRYINPRFSALINGSPVDLTGKTKVDGENFQAQLQLHFTGVNLPAYLAYLPSQQGFTLDKGTGEILMDITFLSGPDDKIRLEIETTSHLSDITIKDRYNHNNLIPEATVRATIYPLLSRYQIKEINLAGPELYLGRRADGQWAFPSLIPPPPATADNAARDTGLVVDKVKVTNARVLFVDDKVTGGFTEIYGDINFTMSDFSRKNQQAAPFTLSGASSGKSTFSFKGDITSSPLTVKGQVEANKLNLQKFSCYLAPAGSSITQGNIEKFASSFTIQFGEKNQMSFANGSLEINNFTLGSQGQIWLILPKSRLSFTNWEATNALATNVQLSAESAEIFMKWDKQNNFNWGQLGKNKGSDAKKKNWQVSLLSLDFGSSLLKIENDFLPTPIRHTQPNVRIKATELSTEANKEGNVVIETDELGGGSLVLSGPMTLSPFSTRLSCKLSNYRLATLATLITDWLNLPRVSGNVSAEGDISLPNMKYSGSLAIHDFSAGQESGPDLVSFATAEATRLNFTLSPLAVSADEVNCDHASIQLIIPAKGPVNTASFFSRNRPGLKDFANNGQINISRINFSDATLAFSDQRVKPVYTSQLQLNGSVGNLINAPGEMLHLNISSAAEQGSTGSITGDIGFFDEALAADFQADLHNMPVQKFSSYLSPLLGYRLADGRFQFSTTYRQQDNHVNTDNSLLVTGLKLGEPQGTLRSQLPLTISLLSDQKGKISLTLPVKGSTTDAAYSLPKSLGRSLQNIILKTSVSPFAQLQSNFPDLEQSYDHLLFPPGKADLSPENKKMLSLYAQVLEQRPLLTLTLKGYADEGSDTEALTAEKREIARVKQLQEELKKSTQITQKYGKEEISPGNQQQAPPPAPPRPAVDVSVSKNELLQLAQKRQKAVYDFLVSALSIDTKRVIQDSSAALVPANATGRPGTRVDLKIGTSISR